MLKFIFHLLKESPQHYELISKIAKQTIQSQPEFGTVLKAAFETGSTHMIKMLTDSFEPEWMMRSIEVDPNILSPENVKKMSDDFIVTLFPSVLPWFGTNIDWLNNSFPNVGVQAQMIIWSFLIENKNTDINLGEVLLKIVLNNKQDLFWILCSQVGSLTVTWQQGQETTQSSAFILMCDAVDSFVLEHVFFEV